MGELFKFEKGASVKDKLTGFEGVVDARCDWLNGAVQHLVRPRNLDDGKMISAKWIDEFRLELVNTTVFPGPTA